MVDADPVVEHGSVVEHESVPGRPGFRLLLRVLSAGALSSLRRAAGR